MSSFSELQERACADYYRQGSRGVQAPPATPPPTPPESRKTADPASPIRTDAHTPLPPTPMQASHVTAGAGATESAASVRTASPSSAEVKEPIPQEIREKTEPLSPVSDSGADVQESSAVPVAPAEPTAESSPPASAADSAHVPPPPEIKLSASGNARTADDDGRRAHEEAEAKRKAEWEEKQAAKEAARKEQRERIAAMSDEAIAAEAVKRVGADTERLTRRNMREMVCEHIQELCRKDAAFARKAMSPEKSMINCFQYINRKAREYAEQEMKDNGIERRGTYGCDVPDGLCYQWAEDYFNDPDAKEDKKDDEKFVPKPYTGSSNKTAVKTDKKKPEKKPETKKAQDASNGAAYQQLTLGV